MLRSNLNTINDRIFNKTAIRIDDQALREVEACYRFLEKFEQGKVIYGINTGFGPMAQYRIGDADLNSLQYNIIRSHSCGAGEALPDICVRAAMLARLQTFLNAKSGVHPDVVRDTGRFPQQRNLPARAAPRQRGRKRRPGAAGAYRTGADRRGGGLVPGRNRPGYRSDGDHAA